MKRFLVTILSFLYMASAMGASVEIHYCMGKAMGANFVHKEDDKCRKCGMHKSKTNGCCKDEHKTIKTSDHQQSKVFFDIAHADIDATLPVLFHSNYHAGVYHTPVSILSQPHAPPNHWRSCPIYLQIRNIRV